MKAIGKNQSRVGDANGHVFAQANLQFYAIYENKFF
jgi:hypothetical protein